MSIFLNEPETKEKNSVYIDSAIGLYIMCIVYFRFV